MSSSGNRVGYGVRDRLTNAGCRRWTLVNGADRGIARATGGEQREPGQRDEPYTTGLAGHGPTGKNEGVSWDLHEELLVGSAVNSTAEGGIEWHSSASVGY